MLPVGLVSRLLHLDVPEGFELNFCFLERVLIDVARNMMAKTAMKHDEDYLFFWDDDQIPDKDILVKMVALDKDIVGCPIPNRKGEKWLAVFDGDCNQLLDIKETQRVGAIGMANTLIKTKVIKELFKKWKQIFHFEVKKNDEGFFIQYSEDITFCRKAAEMGFEIWCDATIKSVHIGPSTGYYYENGEYKQMTV